MCASAEVLATAMAAKGRLVVTWTGGRVKADWSADNAVYHGDAVTLLEALEAAVEDQRVLFEKRARILSAGA